ncbi:putative ribonuclease H-like domain-containing protein [Tanacetum coccineum]|uniref:Ribonuclease H-like domain-containing protein n=1 Tax=Tanacetum coccineum TaxID=301880 RepID=A0ABQ5BT20_9ASTR
MAFVSSPSSTNEVNTAYGVSTTNSQVSPASTQVLLMTLEEMDLLKWHVEVALLARRKRKFLLEMVEVSLFNRSDTARYDKSRDIEGFVSYYVVPHSTGLFSFSPPTLDLSNSGLEEFQQPEFEGYGPKSSKTVSEYISNEGHPQKEDRGYVDSGCSMHMTGNMSYLSDFKEFIGGDVTFGVGANSGKITSKGTLKTADESQVLLKVPRKNNMYSVDIKNIIPKESLTCLVAKATLDESMLWHRRLGKATQSLFLMHKKYGLVVTDDYSRYTWVFFLATKDETTGILKKFIIEIENLVDKKVKIIRCDNRTEFKNSVINDFCAMKGIRREFSVARTPQQNGVAERRNGTLIEATRTIGRTPALSFMTPFGCHVTILNTLDHLGKFDGKSDDRFFVGYSLNSKAFRVYNIRTRKVEENLHIRFLEDKPIVVGDGPKWLFDINVLTKSMNYIPVVAGTNSNDSVGTKESVGIGHSSKETGSSQDYILIPLWKDGLLSDSSSKNANNDEPQPSSDAGKKDDEGISQESGLDNQEKPENITLSLFEATHADFFGDELELDISNINTIYPVPSTPNTRINKDHSLDHVIGDVQSSVQIRRMINEQGFISTVYERKTHKDLHNFLFACFLSREEPKKGYTQEEGIDYDEVFAPVTRIEAIRLFLAYALFKDFVVYQIDVKSAFLYDKIEEEVYICQPLGVKGDILLVQVYVDDIIFGSTRKEMYTEFEKIMHKRFQMSSMGELTFFLGLQVAQKDDGILISQDKYVDEILKKFNFLTVKTASTLMETLKPLLKDTEAEDVDVHLYRSMIGSLIYLTASRPDIMFAVCVCARFQVTPKVSHLHAVKRIFRYLKGQPKLGLWYPKDSPFDLEAYTDSDYAGASLDRKSTTGDVEIFPPKTSLIGFLNWMILDLSCDNHDLSRLTLLLPVLVYAARHSLTAVRLKLMLPGIIYYCWDSAKLKTVNGDVRIQALVDRKKIIVHEASIRCDLKLEDAEGTACLPNATIFEELIRMSMVKNLENVNKFWMYPRFVQVFVNQQLGDMSNHTRTFVHPSLTKKLFGNIKREGTCFFRNVTPLFETMMVQAPEEVGED